MAPKATKAQIDAKLYELRQFVRENQEMLAAEWHHLREIIQNQSADELKWYMFLNKKAAASNQEQAEHLKQIFALLRSVSKDSTTGVPPPSSDEARASNDAMQARKATRQDS